MTQLQKTKPQKTKLQKFGGSAAILEAVIYVAAFIYYGAFMGAPAGTDTAAKLAFLADNQLMLSVMSFVGYVLFGIILAVLVQALHARLKESAPEMSQFAAVFGYVWVGLVIASGMIENIGLNTVLKLAAKDPEQAYSLWITITTISEGIGGGNEIVGGLWVLLLSIAGLKSNNLPKSLLYVGIFVGTSGVLTTYPADILTEIFGISQIVWFIWIGVILLRGKVTQ